MLSVQVNSNTILKNINTIKKRLRTGTKLCAVVKANAYGFGAVKIAHLLSTVVDCFAVATVDEGLTLRNHGITQDILVFGVCTDMASAVKYNLIITVESFTQAQALIKTQLQPRIHLAINSGMNRFGCGSVHELRQTLQLLHKAKIEGIYTHLAFESDQLPAVKIALERFQKAVHICQQYFPHVIVHAGCSGVIDYPPAHFDMVRIGKAIYGGIDTTQTVITVTSQIIAVKKIKAGTTVGYNGLYTAPRPTVVGVVHGGYANGVPPQFSGKVNVLVGKQPCPVIGRVCMDCFFIDVGHVPNPLNRKVTLIAPYGTQTLCAIARQAEMITCHLLLGFTGANNTQTK